MSRVWCIASTIERPRRLALSGDARWLRATCTPISRKRPLLRKQRCEQVTRSPSQALSPATSYTFRLFSLNNIHFFRRNGGRTRTPPSAWARQAPRSHGRRGAGWPNRIWPPGACLTMLTIANTRAANIGFLGQEERGCKEPEEIRARKGVPRQAERRFCK